MDAYKLCIRQVYFRSKCLKMRFIINKAGEPNLINILCSMRRKESIVLMFSPP